MHSQNLPHIFNAKLILYHTSNIKIYTTGKSQTINQILITTVKGVICQL